MSLVVGYDGGETSKAALAQAITLATALNERLYVVAGVSPAGSMGEEYDDVAEALVEELEPLVLEAVETARAAGVDAEPVLVDAPPADALLTAAVNNSSRMIIVGYGATGRIRTALFGMIAQDILDESDIPVLVVP